MIFVLTFCVILYIFNLLLKIDKMNTKITTTLLFSLCIIGIIYLNMEKNNFIQITFLCLGASLSFFMNIAKPNYPPQKNKKKKEAYISDINYRGIKS